MIVGIFKTATILCCLYVSAFYEEKEDKKD